MVSGPADAAPLGAVEEQPVLGDGVTGLEVNRTTPIESEVWAIENVGPYMLVGGAFLEVRDRSTFKTTPWPYLAAFDPTTGEHAPWFQVQPNGTVYDIVDLGNGRALLAGEFTTVNGVAGTDKIAIIDTATGLVDTSYSFQFSQSDKTAVRAVAISGDWLYATGAFTTAAGGNVSANTRGLARFSLASGQLDAGWTPELRGGDGFGIGVASNGRVFVGGYFETVNGVDGTETLAALSPIDGSLVPGWNHGFPYERCAVGWRDTCGAINGLAMAQDRVFVAGAKHFWAALDSSDGTILAANEVTNDGQSVDLVGDKIVIGCHCETATTSDEFNNIAHRYIRVIDPVAMTEIASPTVNSRGAAGGWAAGLAPDGCLWGGGNLTSTFVNGVRHPAWNLLRFCPTGGAGTNPVLPAPPQGDQSAPAGPASPTISTVRGASVDLSWGAVADDSGQVAYLIFRNGALVGRTSSTSYSDKLLSYSSTHFWQIAAVDMAGNQSDLSGRSTPVRIGARVNVAPQSTATQSSDYDATTTADKAIDGLLSLDPATQMPSRTGTRAAGTDPWIDLDLGSVIYVDSIELHPRRDSRFTESNQRPRIYYDTTPVTADNRADASVGGHSVWQGDVVRLPAEPRIDVAPIAEAVRHLRIYTSQPRTSFDEIRVFTATSQPTPSQPAADTTNPSDPGWSRVVTRGSQSILEWGGATDNTAVAFYEITAPDGSVSRTTSTRLPVGAPGQLSRSFQVVSVDAAGNRSRVVEPPPQSAPVIDCAYTPTADGISLSWTPPANADRFIVRRSVNGGTSYWRGSVNAPATSFVDSSRSGTLEYSVEARFGAIGTTPTVCSEEAAAAPLGLRVTREDRRLVVLNYQAGGQPVEIERNGVVVATDPDNWFVDSGLEPGTDYTYRVRFQTPGAAWSDPVTATTAGGVSLAMPQNCAVVADANGFSLTWDPSADADTYVVERRVNGGTWWWRTRTSDTNFADSFRSGTVEYRVRAIANNDASPNAACT